MLKRAVLTVVALALIIAACTQDQASSPEPTVDDSSATNSTSVADGEPAVDETALPVVFAEPFASVDGELLDQFLEGQSLFNVVWTPAGEGDPATDGLGPLFNASSCADCHLATGRRQVPPNGELTDAGLVVRLSVPQIDPIPERRSLNRSMAISYKLSLIHI